MPTDGNAVPTHAVPAHVDHSMLETGNDRFKKSFASWFWSSIITATVFHFMLFQFWPTQTAEVVAFGADELTTIVLPPERLLTLARGDDPFLAVGLSAGSDGTLVIDGAGSALTASGDDVSTSIGRSGMGR